jgi:hypothetical protein
MSNDTIVNRGFDRMKNYKSLNGELNTNFYMTNLVVDMAKGGDIKNIKRKEDQSIKK